MTTKINTSQLYTTQELLALMKVDGNAWNMVLLEMKKLMGVPADAALDPRVEAGMEAAFPAKFMEDYLYIASPGQPASVAQCIIVTGVTPKEEGGVVFKVTLAFPVQGAEAFVIVEDASVVTVSKEVDGETILGLARADQFSAIVPHSFN